MMEKRIQRKRIKGWKMPENTVSVTRPGFFGNPFRVGKEADSVEDSLAQFEIIASHPAYKIMAQKRLKGKNLACFCPLDKPCHADILLKIANS